MLKEKNEVIENSNLKNALKNAIKAVDKKDDRAILRNIHYFTKNGSLFVGATNCHILYLENLGQTQEQIDKLINYDHCYSYLKGYGSLIAKNNDTRRCFSYPGFDNLLTGDYVTSISFKAGWLLPLLKAFKQMNRTQLYSRKNKPVITFKIEKNKDLLKNNTFSNAFLNIFSKYESSENIARVPVIVKNLQTVNEQLNFSFKLDYLITSLSGFNKNENVTIDFMENILRPIRISNQGGQKIYIIAPVKIIK